MNKTAGINYCYNFLSIMKCIIYVSYRPYFDEASKLIVTEEVIRVLENPFRDFCINSLMNSLLKLSERSVKFYVASINIIFRLCFLFQKNSCNS